MYKNYQNVVLKALCKLQLQFALFMFRELHGCFLLPWYYLVSLLRAIFYLIISLDFFFSISMEHPWPTTQANAEQFCYWKHCWATSEGQLRLWLLRYQESCLGSSSQIQGSFHCVRFPYFFPKARPLNSSHLCLYSLPPICTSPPAHLQNLFYLPFPMRFLCLPILPLYLTSQGLQIIVWLLFIHKQLPYLTF